MKDLADQFEKVLRRAHVNDERINETPIAGVHTIKYSQPGKRGKQYWGSSLSIVALGCKEIVLGRDVYRCEALKYVATPLVLPVVSRIFTATPEKPFLCLKIDFDARALSEVMPQIETQTKPVDASRAFFIGDTSDEMLEATIRLIKLFQSPEDARALGPLAIKEIFYHLLKGPHGPALQQFVRSGSKINKISRAIYELQTELQQEIDVPSLAKAANMSRSSFFKSFKEITAMSPIQYQKRLRLLEARRLMFEEGESAEGSAFKVGYNSASQFSREYSRMFGTSPLRDTARARK